MMRIVPFSEVPVGKNFSTHNSPVALYMKMLLIGGYNSVRICITDLECAETVEKGGHPRYFKDDHMVIYSSNW